jgi:methyl-accepting chemotaxis protein
MSLGSVLLVLAALVVGAVAGWRRRDGEIGTLRDELDAARAAAGDAGDAAQRVAAERERQLTAAFTEQHEVQRTARSQAQTVVRDTTAAVVEQLGGLVDQVGAVREAAAVIDRQVATADEVTRAVLDRAAEADRVTRELAETLRRIREVAGLIASVAAQTNLLALNASIEAARAGDAGRGFNVVAGEVKELAATSGRSSADISATIDGLEEGARAVAEALLAMSDDVGHINEATIDLRSVAADQRRSVDELDRRTAAVTARLEQMVEVTAAIEARSADRLALEGSGRLRIGGGPWRPMRIVDLSEGGLGCVVDAGAPGGRGDVAEVELPLGDATVTVSATLMRRSEAPGGHELGLRFEDVDPALVLRVEAGLAGPRRASVSPAPS